MKNKLVNSLIAVALAAGASIVSADVTLYGQLDLSIDASDRDGVRDDVNMGSNRSSFGVKGSEDLGNGMAAFFKLEWQVDIDDADIEKSSFNEDETSSGFSGRDQYIGLSFERFGKLTFGTMSTAYKSDATALDPAYRTRIQSRNVGLHSILHKGKGDQGEGRATNTVRYDSPSWNGLSGTVHYTFDNDQNAGNVQPGKSDEDDDPYGAGIRYKGGNLYAFASYITNNQSGDSDAYQVGAKYTMNAFAFWGMYEFDRGLISTQTFGTGNDGDGADVWNLGGSWTIGNNMLAFRYGQSDDTDAKVGGEKVRSEYNTWSITGQHKFSNRTKVYAGFSEQDCDKGNQNNTADVKFCEYRGEDDIFTLGMRHNF
jgi:predicted porin